MSLYSGHCCLFSEKRKGHGINIAVMLFKRFKIDVFSVKARGGSCLHPSGFEPQTPEIFGKTVRCKFARPPGLYGDLSYMQEP